MRPAKIVEIGSGSSTVISASALSRNAAEDGRRASLTAVDPFATENLRQVEGVRFERIPAQALDPGVVEGLESGDLLFLDLSHALKTGSELAHVYLELVPVLRPGVLVHIHDIALPYPFVPDVLDAPWDWQESVLLAALLTGNDRLHVECCLSALHGSRQDELRALLPDYDPVQLNGGLVSSKKPTGHHPSSIWIVSQ